MAPPPDELQACSGPIQPGPAPLRRLTRVEYDNTVSQLLSDTSRPARAFPPDEEAGGFDNQAAAQSVSPLLAENYLNAAETLAARTAERRLPTLAGCPAPSDAATCEASVRVFIQSFGLRAWRRPLAADEIQECLDLFDQGAALGEGDFDARAGFELMLAAMLQSPHFLYRVEFGDGEQVPDAAPDVTALTDYEIATRLSYFFWNTMPDEGLFEAAARGELHTAEQIEAQARRLLATPRAREAVKTFHRQWLGLDEIEHIKAFGKNPEIYPDYDETLLPLLQEEAERFIEHVIFDGEGTMSALFTAPYSMMNRRLAEWYGVSGPEGDDFEEVDLDPAIYSGFLSQAGLLALHSKPDRSSPIHRGLFVRKRLLCQIPPPPPDIVPEAPLVDETQTTRQQFAQHKTDPLCAGCHRMIDEIGFGFESFDGLGRYRETEWGLPIDDTGNMFETVDIDGPFDGVVGLGERLAGSEQVRDCVVRQWFRFGQGRVETVDDACTLATLRSTFEDSGRDIRELLVTLPQTDAFRYRRVVVPGGE
ncbi:MAG: DUF1592 domain-containing protein [Myxococcales bacterium]|nr:DUF1592 domain-containing protein [Myxococcales bacterium]